MKKKNGKEKQKGRLIPEGELKCVWMEAGVVSYKLCDYEYECERCPFDQVLKKRANASYTLDKTVGEKSDVKKIPIEKNTSGEFPFGPESVDLDNVFQEMYDIKIKGNLFYHPGHTWVDVENPNCVKMGLDDFAVKCLLGIRMAILPTVQNSIGREQVCCWIVEEQGTLPITAPLTGSVIAVNHHLSKDPSLINRSPYEQGWLMKIEPEDLHQDFKHLYRENEILPRYKQDLEKLRGEFESLLRENWRELGPTLCDGGKMLDHVRDMIGPKRYFELINIFFTRKQAR